MSQVHSNLHRSPWADWWEGTRRTDIWWTLAWFDIVLRYRRSMLGPLWLTLPIGFVLAFVIWFIFSRGLQLSLPIGPIERSIP